MGTVVRRARSGALALVFAAAASHADAELHVRASWPPATCIGASSRVVLPPFIALEMTAVRYTYRPGQPRDYDWTELQLTGYVRDRWTVTWGVSRNWWASDTSSRFVEGTYRCPLPAGFVLDTTLGYQMAQRAVNLSYGYGEAGLSRGLGPFVVRLSYAAVERDARTRFAGVAGNRWVASLTWQN